MFGRCNGLAPDAAAAELAKQDGSPAFEGGGGGWGGGAGFLLPAEGGLMGGGGGGGGGAAPFLTSAFAIFWPPSAGKLASRDTPLGADLPASASSHQLCFPCTNAGTHQIDL